MVAPSSNYETLTSFHKTRYERTAGNHKKAVHCNLLPSVIATWKSLDISDTSCTALKWYMVTDVQKMFNLR